MSMSIKRKKRVLAIDDEPAMTEWLKILLEHAGYEVRTALIGTRGEELFKAWRPAAVVSYSAGRFAGVRAAAAWHGILSEMGMVVVSSTIPVGPIGQTLSAEAEPIGAGGQAVDQAFPRFADDLMWWVEAAKAQRARKAPPY